MSTEQTIPSTGREDPSAEFRRKYPDTFARYLARRKMVFLVAYVGYVCAYLVRNNFKLTSEEMRLANDWSLTHVGLILTAFTITYGFGKFFMGMVVDRTSLRKTFSLALGVSAGICIVMGFTRSLPLLFILMLLLGMVQGALAPASMTMIANWFPNKTRGSGIAIWNTSQNLGGAGLPLIITALLAWSGPGNLAVAFWVPGIVVIAISFLFYMGNFNYPLLLVCSGLMGTLIYGPQLIVNILTLNFVPLRIAGVAIGFVGLFGYIVGEMCANLIMPILAERFSWTVSLTFLSGIAVAAGIMYILLRRHEAKTVHVSSD